MTLPSLLFAGLFLSVVAAAIAIVGYTDSRPTRSDCIVGFRLDWSQVKADRHEVRNSLHLGFEGAQRIGTSAAIAISLIGAHVYLQFPRDCDKKEELAAEVIAFWRSKGLDLPRFERIEEPIVPSTKTIEVWGPSWRDEPEDTWGAPRW